ncbi:MAG: hypothetical protein IT281_03755 [Ignavibacteria bacterium]|nr:hypothetical protein [Ignavibacteria bacterium]MCC7158633.1 hypothetical protein [Ignavibacteria bacterium]
MLNKYSSRRITIAAIPLFLFFLIASGALLQESKKDSLKVNSITEKKASEETPVEEEPSGPADTVKIGAYIFSLYDLDFPGRKLNIDFYLWYNASRDSIDMLEYLEVMNATEYNKSGETSEKRGKNLYQTVRINSTIKEEWDVSHFPFDRQKIEIYIEDFDKDNSKLVFVADTIASRIDKNVHIDGWEIKDFGIKVLDHVYETNYGDPNIPINEFSSYSRAVIFFTIEREGNGLFFKLFIGLFISVLISLLTFFINPLDLDPRFGLSVGAIFAAIASQYVISSTLPQNESLTLVDILHDISFIYIFLCILISTISLNFMKNGKEKKSQALDRYSLFIFAGSYFVLIIYFVLRAVN